MNRERAAAARLARERAAAKRKRTLAGVTAAGVVLLVVLVMVLVRVGTHHSNSDATDTTTDAQLAAAVTSVPAATLDQVGQGSVATLPSPLTGHDALTADGKPEVLYVGAEYCPYCAATRWGLAIALSRFGTFDGLGKTWSGSDDVYPNTPTLTFHGSTYTSDYLTFVSPEIQGRVKVNGQYQALDSLTADQSSLVQSIAQGAVPFVDFGNKYTLSGAPISPDLFKGLNHDQVIAALSDPSSALGQAILGSANAFTTLICGLTGGQPGDVCTSTAAQAYAGQLGG